LLAQTRYNPIDPPTLVPLDLAGYTKPSAATYRDQPKTVASSDNFAKHQLNLQRRVLFQDKPGIIQNLKVAKMR